MHQSVLGGKSLKLVGSSRKLVTGLEFQIFCNLLSKAFVCVQTSADSCTSLSNLIDILQGLLNTHVTVAQLVDVSRELLT